MPPIKGDPRTLSAEDKKIIDAICAPYPRQQSSLFRILWTIQRQYGYVFPAALERAAWYCRVSPTRAYGAMSYYAYFRTKPLARHVVEFCEGPTCHYLGNGRLEHEFKEKLGIHEGVTSPDGQVSVLGFECHGSCHLAPYVYVDDEPIPRVTATDIDRIAAELRAAPADTNGRSAETDPERRSEIAEPGRG